jgi:hypothetical protein
MPDLNTALEFGKAFGFPALVVAALFYMIWRGARAVFNQIVIPGFKRLLQHWDCIEGLHKRVDERTARIEQALPYACRHSPPPWPAIDLGRPSAVPRAEPPPLTGQTAPA